MAILTTIDEYKAARAALQVARAEETTQRNLMQDKMETLKAEILDAHQNGAGPILAGFLVDGPQVLKRVNNNINIQIYVDYDEANTEIRIVRLVNHGEDVPVTEL